MTVRFADESEDPEAATSSHDPHEVNEITPLYVQVSIVYRHVLRGLGKNPDPSNKNKYPCGGISQSEVLTGRKNSGPGPLLLGLQDPIGAAES